MNEKFYDIFYLSLILDGFFVEKKLGQQKRAKSIARIENLKSYLHDLFTCIDPILPR